VDLKQLPALEKAKIVMCSITWKLNSTSGMMGKATADKMTAKVVDKNSIFRFSVRIYLNMDFCIIDLWGPPRFVCLVFSLCSNIFV